MPTPFPPTSLPDALARDGWWFDAGPAPARPSHQAPQKASPLPPTGLAVLALVALGDLLFWGHAPGLSVALFVLALFGTGLLLRRPQRWKAPLAVLLLAVLPVVDLVQPLSLAFAGFGLIGALTWAYQGQEAGGKVWLGAMAGFALHLPMALPAALPGLWRGGLAAIPTLRPAALLRGWALPVGGGLVLAALLLEANPILSDLVGRFSLPHLDLPRLLARILFWLGLATLIWPMLTPAPQRPPAAPSHRARRPLPGLNPDAIARALVLFNLGLGLQTLLDVTYLWGGAALPEGMSAAEYAHRGAYPLMATALLAGAFALAARPFLAERRGLKPLMLLWLAQNIALTASALLRLDHYVGLYGLTWLRLAAAIWMGLVALGLMLTLWQIARARPNGWLLLRCALLGLATLYLCSFVNFAAVIARANLDHPALDLAYICTLGPMASAELSAHPRGQVCVIDPPQITGWRDWGFRAARVLRYTRSSTKG